MESNSEVEKQDVTPQVSQILPRDTIFVIHRFENDVNYYNFPLGSEKADSIMNQYPNSTKEIYRILEY